MVAHATRGDREHPPELAAAQAIRPAPSLATFAPDCVTAGGALPQRRRRAGANLAGFKEMAEGMMKS